MKKMQNQFACSRIMLPEHVEALNKHAREVFVENSYKIPEFDEQQLEEFNILLQRSINQGLCLKITYLSPTGFKTLAGRLKKASEGYLFLETGNDLKAMPAKKLIAVEEQ
ncbi:MAG: YolD-like family protein [Firmicutes bacterium]|nr:YolD-like family protein [Bacillota bacterium]